MSDFSKAWENWTDEDQARLGWT